MECGHAPELDCGCWVDEEGSIHRHSFSRFGALKGVTGTVQRWSGGKGYVLWDDHCKNWAPSSFPSNFEIRRIAED